MNLHSSYLTPSWLAVAETGKVRDDDPGEEAALDAHLRLERRNLPALLGKGELLARRGDERAASSFFRLALKCASLAGNIPPSLHPRLICAQTFLQQAHENYSAEVRDRLEQLGVTDGRVSARVSHAARLLLGDVPLYVQQPGMFYFPGLEQRPFFERDEFEWLPAVEAETSAIQDEVRAILAAGGAGFGPHTASDPRAPPPNSHLLDDPSWSAFHLWKQGKEVRDNTRQAPRTVAALSGVPIPANPPLSPMVMFSLLKPGTQIPAHYGSTNTRLICHLPLFVPDGCGLRVASETRTWEVGRALIFDDSFEHEAWNRGSGTRIVLLFEIWRPDISIAERDELTALFEAVEMTGTEN